MDLQGKTAVVTGASRGIGRGIAVALARAGARTFCISTKAGGCDETIAACREFDVPVEALACDVADAESVDAMAKQVLDAAGGLDILVNNAGITADGVFLRMKPEDFDRVLAVNLRGAFLTCKAFSRPLAKAGAGRIVNVGSVVGLTGNAGQANYAASKAGLIGLTKSLAREFAGRNVTANVVAPGFVETDMTAGLSDQHRAQAIQNVPLGRFGTAQDIAGAVCFLCSDAAAYVTGQVLVVDGGMTM